LRADRFLGIADTAPQDKRSGSRVPSKEGNSADDTLGGVPLALAGTVQKPAAPSSTGTVTISAQCKRILDGNRAGSSFPGFRLSELEPVQDLSRIDVEKSAYHQQSQNESWVEARIARQRRKAHEALRPVRSRVRVIASNRESPLKTASNRLGS